LIEKKCPSVLFVTPWFPNEPGERNGSYIYESFKALRETGMDAFVLVCRPWLPRFLRSFASEWMRGDVNTAKFPEADRLDTLRYLRIPRLGPQKINNFLFTSRLLPSIEQRILANNTDVFHVHTEEFAPLAAKVKQRLGISCIVSIHGQNTESDYFKKSVQRKILSESLNAVDRVLLVGEPLRSVFKDITKRDDHFHIVANGVRLEDYTSAPTILHPNRPPTFISVSNLHEGKGVDITLRALAALRNGGMTNWRYIIVGDGYQRAFLENLARLLKISDQVRFLGLQPHSRIPGLLREADVFVLPSYREAFGIVYIEAMAAGLLTIGVHGQGPEAFIVDNNTGFLIAPQSIESLHNRLVEIFQRPDQMRSIAAAGQKFVQENMSWNAHATRLIEIYTTLTRADIL
jgi:glycosyltransferase involved in cell wall biosynthesis